MIFNKLKKIKRNKKGFLVGDLLFFGLILLILGIIIIVSGNLITNFSTKLNESSLTEDSKDIFNTYENRFNNIWDFIFLFIFMMFGISIVASLYFLDSNPALFFVIIILLAFALLVTGIFSNVFENFTETGEQYKQAEKLQNTNFLMDNIVLFVLVFGVIGVIILYAQIGR